MRTWAALSKSLSVHWIITASSYRRLVTFTQAFLVIAEASRQARIAEQEQQKETLIRAQEMAVNAARKAVAATNLDDRI